MKKSFFKRSTSALLAFLMCFTTLIGIGGVTAFAAGTESTAVMIGFPRDGDNNYNGTWGHGNMSFMNGWSSSATTYSLIYGVGSYMALIWSKRNIAKPFLQYLLPILPYLWAVMSAVRSLAESLMIIGNFPTRPGKAMTYSKE